MAELQSANELWKKQYVFTHLGMVEAEAMRCMATATPVTSRRNSMQRRVRGCAGVCRGAQVAPPMHPRAVRTY